LFNYYGLSFKKLYLHFREKKKQGENLALGNYSSFKRKLALVYTELREEFLKKGPKEGTEVEKPQKEVKSGEEPNLKGGPEPKEEPEEEVKKEPEPEQEPKKEAEKKKPQGEVKTEGKPKEEPEPEEKPEKEPKGETKPKQKLYKNIDLASLSEEEVKELEPFRVELKSGEVVYRLPLSDEQITERRFNFVMRWTGGKKRDERQWNSTKNTGEKNGRKSIGTILRNFP